MSNGTASSTAQPGSTSRNNYYVTFPYDELIQPEFAVPPTGACCACSERNSDSLITPPEFFGQDEAYCKMQDDYSMTHGAGIMFTMAEGGQTCSNACVAKLDPSLKETAKEEFDQFINSHIIYGEVEKGEGPLAPLKDMCICSGIDNAVSFVTDGIVSKDDLTEHTFDTWEKWNHARGLAGVEDSNPIVGIPEGDSNATCTDVCNTLLGKPTAEKDADIASFEPMYIGLPRSVAGFDMAEF